jgi:uncharacterized phage-associated protein
MLQTHKLEELMVFVSRHPKVVDLGLTKLWKLVFFIDQEALRKTGHTITGSEYIKYEHGPVPSRGEKHLKKLRREGVVSCRQRDRAGYLLNEVRGMRQPLSGVLSGDELTVADTVCGKLGRMTAARLSELSHKDPAWHYAELLQKLSPSLMAYASEEDPDGL